MSKFQELILRREKHEDAPAIPLPVRAGAPRIEPPPAVAAVQDQQTRVAVGVGNRLVHNDHVGEAKLFLRKLLTQKSGGISRRFAVTPTSALGKNVRRGSLGVDGELVATNKDRKS